MVRNFMNLKNILLCSLFNQQGWNNNTVGTYDSRNRHSLSNFTSYSEGSSAYAVELLHEKWSTHHFNDDFSRDGIIAQFKHDISPQDRLYASILYQESEQGDVRQITKPGAAARPIRNYTIDANGRATFSGVSTSSREVDGLFGRDPELRIENWQEPLVFLSYAREWSPEHTTLALVGHTQLRSRISDPLGRATMLGGADPEISYYSEQDFELQSLELQHIFRNERNQLILGARYQDGELDDSVETLAAINDAIPPSLIPILVPTAVDSAGTGSTNNDFSRWSAYAYYTRDVTDRLSLIGGLGLEGIDFADGLQSTARTTSRKEKELFSPKLGVIWQMHDDWVLRAAASRSLSGYSIEDQLRLEPSQIGGLVSSYRSLIPTSATGTMAGGTNDVFNINLSGALNDRTFTTFEAFHGRFSGDRAFGLFEETIR